GHEMPSAVQRSNRRLSVLELLRSGSFFPQPGLWVPLQNCKLIGLDDRFNYAFDWDFGLKYFSRYPCVAYIDDPVVFFRLHDKSKSMRDRELFRKEGLIILSRLSR